MMRTPADGAEPTGCPVFFLRLACQKRTAGRATESLSACCVHLPCECDIGVELGEGNHTPGDKETGCRGGGVSDFDCSQGALFEWRYRDLRVVRLGPRNLSIDEYRFEVRHWWQLEAERAVEDSADKIHVCRVVVVTGLDGGQP